jgi:UDP-N-acetylglucosamine--N-acetylmuramyl-(pentapeptide) pyrophosphoryl-undecaprenol N-acetylglucosamine transferase
MRIIFLAGGSGGHISPAIAVADSLRKLIPKTECIFFCSRNSLDDRIFRETKERYFPVFSGKWRRYFSWRNFLDIFSISIGFFQALFLLIRFRPDVVFSKGGFVALPASFAAFLLRIPIIVHESDVVPGIANRLIQRFTKEVVTSFPVNFGECVGTPIRPEIFSANAQKGRGFLQFSEEKKILFIFGGSQGSQLINDNVQKALSILQNLVNIVWITGTHFDIPKKRGIRCFPYLHNYFFDVLAAADIIVSRAGSNSLFEIATLRKPMILVPLKNSAGNHQEKNARFFSSHNAAEIIFEQDLSPERLQRSVLFFIKEKKKREKIASMAKRLAKPKASEKIAKKIIALAKTHSS